MNANPLLIIGLLALVAILAIAYVNREKCVQEGDPCGSSSKGCCANLVCRDDVCSKPIEDTYKKFEQSECFQIGTPIIKKSNTSEEDFIKENMNRCDQCRKDPSSDPWCYTLQCEGFNIIDGKTAYICDLKDYPINSTPGVNNKVYKHITDES